MGCSHLKKGLPERPVCLEQQRDAMHVVANLTATADAFNPLSPALADANLLS
jgi:hypothetical protein